MNVVELNEVVKRFGSITAVDKFSLEVRNGQCVSLLGPSGCGKTTTLNIIAGFEPPDQGTVLINGADMRGKRPYERNIGLVFQDYALFPHMTVDQNIAYGMRHRGVDKRTIARRTGEILELVKLPGFGQRRPSLLSGGEQQRVALARALVTEPAVMLLDEPLSNLDAKLRQELRLELKEILASVGTTTIIVTHDQEEAMTLSEHVIIMNEGRLMQQGPPGEIYARPKSRFVAEFIGRSNWFQGHFRREAASGVWEYETTDGLTIFVATAEAREGASFEVGTRPERIAVDSHGAAEGARSTVDRNLLLGTVDVVHQLGGEIHYWVRLASGCRILAVEKNSGQALKAEGTQVCVRFDPKSCIVVPVASEN